MFLIITIAPEFYDCSKPLPPHRLVFNSIGDADVCGTALEAAEALLAQTSAPVINSPAAVLASSRLSNSERLGCLPGVRAARIVRLPRVILAGCDGVAAVRSHNLTFPLLLRRPGFHTGEHFVCVETPEALSEAAAGLPGAKTYWLIEYLNARAMTAGARKYRVMSIG